MASRSEPERLAELRAALRELEACVAELEAKRAAARGYDPRQMSGVRAVVDSFDDARAAVGDDARASVRGDARAAGRDDARAAGRGDAFLTITAAKLVDAQGRPAKVLRLLRPRIQAVVDWWRRAIWH